MPKIKKLVVGFLDTNCYIISHEKKAVLIDPGDNAERILRELSGLKLEKIILTHLHFDHIIAAKKVREATGAKIYCHKADLKILTKDIFSEKDIDVFLKDKEMIKGLNDYMIKCLHVPGHTPGSICLYFVGAPFGSPVLFSGDTIFAGSIGVTNYPGGDFKKIKDSIEKKLLTLPDDTKVYPGHYKEFRLGDEKEAIRKVLEQ